MSRGTLSASGLPALRQEECRCVHAGSAFPEKRYVRLVWLMEISTIWTLEGMIDDGEEERFLY